jgi:Rap1a immunity proteins
MHRAILVAAALLLTISGRANAIYFTGNDLWVWCQHTNASQQKPLDAGLCTGYIWGVVDVFVDAKRMFCVPQGNSGVRTDQLLDVVLLYLRDHPETRHQPAPALVINALKEKFPCN